MKKRITFTLDAGEIALVERAARTLTAPGDDGPQLPVDQRKSFESWLAKLAIRIVAVAIVRKGQLVFPPAADLRYETPEERAARLGEDGPLDRGGDWLVE